MTGPLLRLQASRAPTVGWSVLDQLFSSGTNLALVITAARRSTPEQFGLFSIYLLVHGLALGLLRRSAGDVMVLEIRGGATPRAALAVSARWFAGGAAVMSTVFLAVAALTSGQSRHLALAMAAAQPIVYAQDLTRYVGFSYRRPSAAALSDGLWLAVLAGAWWVLSLNGDVPLYAFVLAWAAGALVGLSGSAHTTYAAIRRSEARTSARRASPRRWSFGADYVLSNGVAQIGFMGCAALLDLAEFAALRGALLAFSLVTTGFAVLRVLFVGWLGSQSVPSTRTLLAGGLFGTAVAVPMLGWGAALSIIPADWGERLLGDTWSAAVPLLGAALALEIVRAFLPPAVDHVLRWRAGRETIRLRALTGGAMLVGTVGGALTGSALTSLRGMLIGQAIGTTAWWLSARHMVRSAGQRDAGEERT